MGTWSGSPGEDAAATHEVVVTVEPLGAAMVVAHGETVFEAAFRQGYAWPTRCHAQAKCTFCVLEVVSGGENALPAQPEEAAVLDRIRRLRSSNSPYRLACRLKVRGDVVVRKDGVQKLEE